MAVSGQICVEARDEGLEGVGGISGFLHFCFFGVTVVGLVFEFASFVFHSCWKKSWLFVVVGGIYRSDS